MTDNMTLDLLAGSSIYNTEFSQLNATASGLITSSSQSSYVDGSESSSGVLGSNSSERIQSFFLGLNGLITLFLGNDGSKFLI